MVYCTELLFLGSVQEGARGGQRLRLVNHRANVLDIGAVADERLVPIPGRLPQSTAEID